MHVASKILNSRIGLPILASLILMVGAWAWFGNQPKSPTKQRRFNKLRMLAREADLPTPTELEQKIGADKVFPADLDQYQEAGQDADLIVLRLIKEGKITSYQRIVKSGWQPQSKHRCDDLLLASINKPDFLRLTLKLDVKVEGHFLPRAPIAFAATNMQSTEGLAILAEAGANVNRKTQEPKGASGGPPVSASILLIALTRSNQPAVELLLQYGAKWDITDSIGRYPLEIIIDRSVYRRETDPTEKFRRMIRRLEESGAITKQQVSEALTPAPASGGEAPPNHASEGESREKNVNGAATAPNGKWTTAQ